MTCNHNERTRYTHGFQCNSECKRFIGKESAEYRATAYLSELWMALHNVNAQQIGNSFPIRPDIETMINEIGIGKVHTDFESIIERAEALLVKYGSSPDDAAVVIG